VSSKIEKIQKINSLFDEFVSHISEVKDNVEKESIYRDGYNQCLIDIINALNSDEPNALLESIRGKVEMQSRKSVLNELTESLSNLNKAYKRVAEEE
tara:strand:- start:2702 stop:2992 length:291 start_codon:yes stop_codon:yes gene_type:complete